MYQSQSASVDPIVGAEQLKLEQTSHKSTNFAGDCQPSLLLCFVKNKGVPGIEWQLANGKKNTPGDGWLDHYGMVGQVKIPC
jgi:hypothetical protein